MSNIDPKIPTEALEGLMKKVFIDQAVEPGLFWDAAIKAHLIMPLAKTLEKAPELASDEDVQSIPVQLGVDSKGRSIVWVFTSPQVMTDYTDDHFTYVKLEGQQMFQKVLETKFEVVLIGPENLTLSLDRNLVESLANGEVPKAPEEKIRKIAKNTEVKVGEPAEDTSGLEERFIKLFEDNDNILEAAFMQVADDSGSRLILGLIMEKESRDILKNMAALIAKAAEGVLEPGKTMDITLINGSLKAAFEKYGKTFYKK